MSDKEVKTVEKAEKTKAEKPKKAKKDKPSLWKRITGWFKSVKSEAKKISWASWKSVRTNSIIVIVVVIVIAIALGLLDFLFTNAISGLGKLF